MELEMIKVDSNMLGSLTIALTMQLKERVNIKCDGSNYHLIID